ncbi:hypothetical protein E2C01_053865 [Portunus trituberculatus]|uniref:Secreted protein n=1 Tax=Portunus trituberculatus TaxID=210409 RepID=A0A5B7GRM3_PORTR|nr:hypothetical protein [Portunus trituberculatus]
MAAYSSIWLTASLPSASVSGAGARLCFFVVLPVGEERGPPSGQGEGERWKIGGGVSGRHGCTLIPHSALDLLPHRVQTCTHHSLTL